MSRTMKHVVRLPRPLRSRRRLLMLAVGIVVVLLFSRGCRMLRKRGGFVPRDPSLVLVTGYCNCGKCCGWTVDEANGNRPVYDYGKMKGKPKKVGLTATGTTAKHGTIAADPKVFPFGTHLGIPGYGVGTVEDVGGAIKGRHIDIWFPSHEEARKWGARWLRLKKLKYR